MKTLIALILWCILLALCWPQALVMIFLFPLAWLILLPFSIVGLTLGLVFKLIREILLLPFRIVNAL